jgi:RNA polymerase sigma-32 factor
VSYALHWIKAEIHEYILKNWRMVKVATTKAQRKLFFNLRSMKQGFKGEADAQTHRDSLTDAQIDVMARELNVKREEVIEMEARMAGGDVLLDPAPTEEGEEAFGPIAYLADANHEPTSVIESRQRDVMATDGIAAALTELDPRSRRIVEERWLKVNDDGSGGLTLHELAAEYGVSAERIRQIEAAAMKKMKKALAAYA